VMAVEFWSFEAVGFETLATGESLFNLQRASLHWRSRACTTFCPQPGKRPGWRGAPNFKAKASGGDLGRLPTDHPVPVRVISHAT
jgi:hypothetical protein